MNQLRPDLPPLPERIARLPVDKRGFPIPNFVTVIDGEPEFRVITKEKIVTAAAQGLCWVCGDVLGKNKSFVIGPMCALNRVSAEPPSHLECAEFSVRACPFLTKPHMDRRDNDLPEDTHEGGGFMIRRNPGVTLVWTTKTFLPERAGNGFIFRIGDPISLSTWREGRPATKEEIREAFESGLPTLTEMAMKEGPGAMAECSRMEAKARTLLGIA